MKSNTKKQTLMVLSTLVMGTAIIPTFGVMEASAKTSTKQSTVTSTTAMQMGMLDRLKFVERYPNLNLFAYVKQGIMKDLPKLKSTEQVRVKLEMDRVEQKIRYDVLERNFEELSRNKPLIQNIDVNLFSQEASKTPVNSNYYKPTQHLKAELEYMKASFDFEYLVKKADRYPLSPTELSAMDKLATLFPTQKVANAKAHVARVKDNQVIKQAAMGVRLVERAPDKLLIAKAKADVNKLASSSMKTSLLSKIKSLEAKQKTIPQKEVNRTIAIAVDRDGIGRLEVPAYIQEVVKQELSDVKRISPSTFVRMAENFYGKELMEDHMSIYREEVTPDKVIAFNTKVATYEKETGIVNDARTLQMKSRLEERVIGTEVARVKRLSAYLLDAEVENTLKKVKVDKPGYEVQLQEEIDNENAREAYAFVKLYQGTGKKADDYQAALKKVNEIKTQSIKNELLTSLNR